MPKCPRCSETMKVVALPIDQARCGSCGKRIVMLWPGDPVPPDVCGLDHLPVPMNGGYSFVCPVCQPERVGA